MWDWLPWTPTSLRSASLSTSKCHCSTAKQGPAKPGQCWQTAVVSCFQVGCPALGSSAPAPRCAHTVIATVPAKTAEHPENTDMAAFKVMDFNTKTIQMFLRKVGSQPKYYTKQQLSSPLQDNHKLAHARKHFCTVDR